MQRTARLRPIQPPAATRKVEKTPAPAARQALDWLVIGIGDDLDMEAWENTSRTCQLNFGSLRLDRQIGSDPKAKFSSLMECLAALKHERLADEGTVIVVTMHGARQGKGLSIGDCDGEFQIDAVHFTQTLRARLGDSPHHPWKGLILFGACGSAALRKHFKHGPGHNLLLSGHKSISAAELVTSVDKIMHAWSLEPRSSDAPSMEQMHRIWNELREHCGEHVSWSGQGKTFTHKAGNFDFERRPLPHKRARVLAAKLMHGSLESVQRVAGEQAGLLLQHHRVPNFLPAYAASLSKRQSREKLEYLLALGQSINDLDVNGESALYLAALSGERAAVKNLLAAGADPWLPSKAGWFPWQVGEGRVFGLLIADPLQKPQPLPAPPDPEQWPLHAACAAGDAKRLGTINPHPLDLLVRDAQHNTALGVALLHGQFKVMEMLLERGADPNARVNDKEALLAHAVLHGQTYAARLLIRHGAKPVRSQRQGMPLLMRAMHAVHAGRAGMDLLKLILGTDAGKNALKGALPLHYACHLNNPALVMALLEAGADPRQQDGNGLSADHALTLKMEAGDNWASFELKLALLEALQKVDAKPVPGQDATV